MESAGTLVWPAHEAWARCELAAPRRRALMLDLFRIAVSAGLVAHFARLCAQAPGVVGRDGLLPAQAFYETGLLATLAVDASSLRIACGAAALLALGVLAGIAPRTCAALLCGISLGLQRASFEVSTLDDALVSVAAFWLCLLPIGRALSMSGIVAARDAAREGRGGVRAMGRALCALRVEGRSASMCGLHMALLQLDTVLWRGYAPEWPASVALNLSFFGLALGLMAPSAPLRAGAAIGIAALHATLWLGGYTGLQFAHLLLAASPLLLWSACGSEERVVPAWNAASAVGALLLALTLTARLGVAVPDVAESSAKLLRDMGLLPIASGQKQQDAFALWVRGDRGDRATLDVSDLERNPRGRRALGYLASELPSMQALRESVARALVTRACVAPSGLRETGTLQLESTNGLADVAWFDCGAQPREPRVVMLGGVPKR